MSSPGRSVVASACLIVGSTLACATLVAERGSTTADLTRQEILDTMKRATTFMVDKVSTEGGYVWAYLPDLSRRWGELEARDTMVWIQPPGTATVGHLFLDAFHATNDEYYYRAAEKVAGALIRAQHPSGGWNYLHDFAGERSLREWYATIGRNAWRLEEFQYDWGNATFDDAGTAESSKFLLRLYLEQRDPAYKPALDKAIAFVLDSQQEIGAWPQRFPPPRGPGAANLPEYPSYLTFNDDVAAENIDLLMMCYQALGEERLLTPIRRAMDAFLVTQQPRPQAGWALQYTTDLKPAGARTYEPKSLATHTTAANVALLVKFYRLTGDTKYLARIPEALDWLESVKLAPGEAPSGRTHPTFVELGTNRRLYVHRTGSNVFNGRYFVDYNPTKTIRHYSAFRTIDIAGLRKLYEEAKAENAAELARRSPLAPGAVGKPLSRFFVANERSAGDAASIARSLNVQGYWLAPLGSNSHPYTRDGSRDPVPGDFSETMVGDETDTSPFNDETLKGISTSAYIRNMSALIRALQRGQ